MTLETSEVIDVWRRKGWISSTTQPARCPHVRSIFDVPSRKFAVPNSGHLPSQSSALRQFAYSANARVAR